MRGPTSQYKVSWREREGRLVVLDTYMSSCSKAERVGGRGRVGVLVSLKM